MLRAVDPGGTMKILIVDDDQLSRTVLKALLRQHVSCVVLEATDGLEAIAAIQKDTPDAIFLDLAMPFMNGVEVLEAIRADPVYVSLPVIIMSGVGDRMIVQRAVSLGIVDYLVKPLRPLSVDQRIVRLLGTLRSRHERGRARATSHRPAAHASGSRRILWIDPDVHFRAFVAGLFEDEHEIVEASTSLEGLRRYLAAPADVVCLADALSMPNARLLAQKIRALAREVPPAVYLCTERTDVPADERDAYDDILMRSFVPATFRKVFRTALASRGGLYETVSQLVADELHADVVTATRQTVGVTTMQELTMLEEEAAKQVSHEVAAIIRLVSEGGDVSVPVGLFCACATAERIAERLLGGPVDFEDVGADALSELVNTIAGRVATSLDVRGVPLTLGLPSVTKNGAEQPFGQWRIVVPFATEDGDQFFVAVDVQRGDGA